MGIPFFRPPSVEEASANAEGNQSHAEKTVTRELRETITHVRKGAMGLLRAPVSLALAATSRGIDAVSNIWGYPAIVGLRVARYVDDARDGIRKATDFDFRSRGHSVAHESHDTHDDSHGTPDFAMAA